MKKLEEVIADIKELRYTNEEEFNENINYDLLDCYGNYSENGITKLTINRINEHTLQTYKDIEGGAELNIYFHYDVYTNEITFDHIIMNLYIS